MLYRTMARKLLAGSGWIMHSSISKESAKELIRILIGETLYRALQIDGELTEAERVSVDKKEHHCNRLFAGEAASCQLCCVTKHGWVVVVCCRYSHFLYWPRSLAERGGFLCETRQGALSFGRRVSLFA